MSDFAASSTQRARERENDTPAVRERARRLVAEVERACEARGVIESEIDVLLALGKASAVFGQW